MKTNNEVAWEKEWREYFTKTLKPKKPTMANLDLELSVNFIKNVERTTRNTALREAVEVIEEEMKKADLAPTDWTRGMKKARIIIQRLSAPLSKPL